MILKARRFTADGPSTCPRSNFSSHTPTYRYLIGERKSRAICYGLLLEKNEAELRTRRIHHSEAFAWLQKFSVIQTLLSAVSAGIATYFPSRDGTAQLGQMLFVCQIWCALPAKSTYSKLCLKPAGLLVTKSPLESAAQSTDMKPFQFFTTNSRVG